MTTAEYKEYIKKRGYTDKAKATITKNKITGIDIPFMELVTFFVTASIAAVPAAIIVAVFWTSVTIFAGAIVKVLV